MRLAAVMIAALVVVACGGSSNDNKPTTGSTGAPAAKPVTITLWNGFTNRELGVVQILPAENKNRLDLQFRLQPVGCCFMGAGERQKIAEVLGEQAGRLDPRRYAYSGLLKVRGIRTAEVSDAVRSEVDKRVTAESEPGVFMAAQRGEACDRRVLGDGWGELPDDLLDPAQQACLLRREQVLAVSPARGGQGDLPVGEAPRAAFSFDAG